MKKANGAKRSVLGFIREVVFYEHTAEVKAEIRMKNNKPTGRRKIINGSVAKNGTWEQATQA